MTQFVSAPRNKLGKLAATRPHNVGDLASYAQGKLPAPPRSVKPPTLIYPMAGNDEYGNCTIAGLLHCNQTWAALVGEPYNTELETSQAVPTYEQLTGGPDTGLNEQFVLQRASQGSGLLGTKLDAYVPVSTTSITQIHQAIAFFGACYVGVQLPMSAQTQFANKVAWTVSGDLTIEGGHCICFVGYDDEFLYAVTWGAIQPVAYPWWDRFGEEAWACFPNTFDLAKRGPVPSIDLQALKSDLQLI